MYSIATNILNDTKWSKKRVGLLPLGNQELTGLSWNGFVQISIFFLMVTMEIPQTCFLFIKFSVFFLYFISSPCLVTINCEQFVLLSFLHLFISFECYCLFSLNLFSQNYAELVKMKFCFDGLIWMFHFFDQFMETHLVFMLLFRLSHLFETTHALFEIYSQVQEKHYVF